MIAWEAWRRSFGCPSEHLRNTYGAGPKLLAGPWLAPGYLLAPPTNVPSSQRQPWHWSALDLQGMSFTNCQVIFPGCKVGDM